MKCHCEAYCFHCGCERPMKDAELVITKNHRHLMKGRCKVCNHKICTFVADHICGTGLSF